MRRPSANRMMTGVLQAVTALGMGVGGVLGLPPAGFVGLALVSLGLTVHSEYQKHVAVSHLRTARLEVILHRCAEAVAAYQGRSDLGTLRANIMVPTRSGQLGIIAAHDMESDPDRHLTFARGQGCSGEAFDSGQVVVGDLAAVYRNSWDDTRRVHGSAPWGITREQFEATRNLKSLLSIPLRADRSVRGVLNLDDRVDIAEARFQDEELLMIIEGFQFHIENELWGG